MLKHLAFWLTLLTLTCCISTQELARPDIDLLAGQIGIINETGEKQTFFIGDEPGRLYEVEVLPGESWISPVFTGRPHFRLEHGETSEEYMLNPGLQYHLYPDLKKKRPDIRMYRRR